MKRGGGKKKGNRGERLVAQFFNGWAGLKKDEQQFQRVPASGGLRWKKDNRIIGDLVCPPSLVETFPFTIESKKVQSLDFHHLIDGIGCNILKYWDQALVDSRRAKLLPILFMHSNGMGKKDFFVAMPCDVLNLWSDFNGTPTYLEVYDSDDEDKQFVIVNSDWVASLDFSLAMEVAFELVRKWEGSMAQ